jgi:hypothetical protein
MPDLRSLLEQESRSVDAPTDFDRLVRRRDRRRRNRRVAAGVVALAISALALIGLVRAFEGKRGTAPADTPQPGVAGCPAGSTPDEPGPRDQARPRFGDVPVVSAFDAAARRMIVMSWDAGNAWTFDVCSNTWAPLPSPPWTEEGPRALVNDAGSDLTVAIAPNGEVWALDLATERWMARAPWPALWSVNAVYDSTRDLIVVRERSTSKMWTYDADTDVLEPLEQGRLVPVVANQEPGHPDLHNQVMTYDPSVDRLILYLGDACDGCEGTGAEFGGRETWEFDLTARVWTRRQTETPEIGWPFVEPIGDEFVFDPAHGVSVVFSDGRIATYDASAHEWEVLFGDPYRPGGGTGPFHRLEFAMAYDPVNERVVVTAGDVRTRDGWANPDDVWAFDVGTGEWLRLLAPSETASA